MALSLLYLMARWLAGMLLGRLRSEHTKDVEIAVHRHQLEVLRRQSSSPSSIPPIERCWRCCAARFPAGAGPASW